MTVTMTGHAGGDAAPAWVEVSLAAKEGRDPLGLQTTTQDRLMPVLLPGLLELTRRARYFSFYAFLLQEYQQRRLAADATAQSTFIRRREWDLGLAVQRCPRKCGSSPVGARRLGSTALGPGPYPRNVSVESAYGGYGLYYRSPMIQTGLVARTGTLAGDTPITVDVLHDSPRAQALAARFRDAVADTAYYQREFTTASALPADVVDELAAKACLCRLVLLPEERDAVTAALFDSDPEPAAPTATTPAAAAGAGTQHTAGPAGPSAPIEAAGDLDVVQRRRSVAHYLTLLEADPAVAVSEAAYRSALWESTGGRSAEHAVVAGQWAALVAKDVWQDALCSVWSAFCDAGVAAYRSLGTGLDWAQTRELTQTLCAAAPALNPATPTADLSADVAAGRFAVTNASGAVVNPSALTMEELRALTAELDTATSGLVAVLELERRTADRDGRGWEAAAHVASAWQMSVAQVLDALRGHLNTDPSVSDTMWWLVSRFVVPVHERIAYSKLPEFTFRFRWEDGLLRFYDRGLARFPLAAVRNEPLALVTRDLGLWAKDADGNAALTPRGSAFVEDWLG